MASYSPGASQVLDLLHDRVVAFHPALVPILGGPDEALLVSQLLYWDGKGSAPARWIYKTQGEWQREVGLSPHRQRRARRRLRGLGVLEERRGGMPARLYYRLNLAVLAALAGADGAAEGALGAPSSRSTRDRDLDRDTAPEPVGGTSPQHVVDDATIQSAPTARTISENTAQITMWDPACPGPHDLAEIWRRVCANVRLKVRPASFEAWIRPCMLRELEEQGGQTHATIEVPSDYEREWLVYRMRKLLPRALSEELGRDVEVIYCLPGEDAPPAPHVPPSDAACGTPHVPSPPEVSRASDDDGPPDVSSLPEAAQPSGGPVPVSPRPKASASPGASRQEGVSPPLEASGAQKAPSPSHKPASPAGDRAPKASRAVGSSPTSPGLARRADIPLPSGTSGAQPPRQPYDGRVPDAPPRPVGAHAPKGPRSSQRSPSPDVSHRPEVAASLTAARPPQASRSPDRSPPDPRRPGASGSPGAPRSPSSSRQRAPPARPRPVRRCSGATHVAGARAAVYNRCHDPLAGKDC